MMLAFTICFGTAFYFFKYQYVGDSYPASMDAYFADSTAVVGSGTDYWKMCMRYYSAVYADGAFVLGFF